MRNMYQTVVECANRWPQAFAVAHTDHPDKHLFIKLVAWELHKLDERFGLNGKRGNPNDLSMDAINYLGEGIGYDPTRNDRPVTVIDVIGGAGGPNPKPTWQVFNDPTIHRGPGAWVQPKPVEGYQTGEPSKPIEPTPPPINPIDVMNVLTQVRDQLSEVIQSNERTAKKVEELAGKITVMDANSRLDAAEFVAKVNESTERQAESNGALRVAVDELNEKFNRGFVVEGKAGWPVGNIRANIRLKDID